MKFAWTVIVYLLIGLVLGWGILEVVKGHLWVLAAGLIAYIAVFGAIGCTTKGSH